MWGLYPLNNLDYNPHNNISQYGGVKMIKFDRLWDTLKKKGITTYRLREECIIDSKTVRRLRANENVETKTINKLCEVLNCQVCDVLEYQPD